MPKLTLKAKLVFFIEPSDEGEEQAKEKQKSTPSVVMKHWTVMTQVMI